MNVGLPAWSWWLCAFAFVTAALLAWAAIFYARRRGMLDQPGYRRSHQIPTPRGGGIGMVVGAGIAMPLALACLPAAFSLMVASVLGAGGFAVALIGWMDDHHHLGIRPRLLVQLLAAGLLVAVLLHWQQMSWWWLMPCVLVCVWSINLHNFMDGIDAILGLQTLCVGLGMGLLALNLDEPATAMASLALTAAAAGFLVFNWPPARIFMGDVGSGFAGFMIFAVGMLLCVRKPAALWPVLLLSSAFLLDAGWTLVWRMWSGKRWYTAHREHLYQWLVRSGWSHAQSAGAYVLWNLIVVAPLAAWAVADPKLAPWLCLASCVAGTIVWWWARGACLRSRQHKGERHAA